MLRGRKLLLADDSIAIQKVIELTFEDEGMSVVSVGNGQQAVERLEEVRPDIVLADVFMPELNGYEVCERIKRDERFRHVPVILLVGSFEPFNEAEARRVGADDYLTKPFQSIRQMVSKVGSLLSGNKSGEASAQGSSAQTGQAKTENQMRKEDLELTTADTAPLPQQMRPIEPEETNAPPKRPFNDLQLDDEMIEETPAKEFGSAGQQIAGAHQRPTEPFSTRDLAEVGMKSAAPNQNQSFSQGRADALADEARATERAAEPSATPARSATASAATDDALLDLDDVEMPRASAMAEADDFILDLQDSAEAPTQEAAPPAGVAPSMFESAPAQAQESDAVLDAELAEEMTEAAPQAVEYTDAQVVGEEQRAEFAAVEEQQAPAGEFHFYPQPATGTAPEMQAAPEASQEQETRASSSAAPQPAPTAELPEGFQPEATPLQSEAASVNAAPTGETSAAQSGQIELSQLSPEAIDAIARRVVEQLSAKVVEQIAWEVVPPLAELLIKRRLEEKQ